MQKEINGHAWLSSWSISLVTASNRYNVQSSYTCCNSKYTRLLTSKQQIVINRQPSVHRITITSAHVPNFTGNIQLSTATVNSQIRQLTLT